MRQILLFERVRTQNILKKALWEETVIYLLTILQRISRSLHSDTNSKTCQVLLQIRTDEIFYAQLLDEVDEVRLLSVEAEGLSAIIGGVLGGDVSSTFSTDNKATCIQKKMEANSPPAGLVTA